MCDLPIMGILREEFEGFLESFFKALGVEKVTIEDRELLLGSLTDQIRKLERARRGLSHEWATIDGRGRITIRKRLMVQVGWKAGDTVDVHLYPNPGRPRGLLLLREER